MNAQKEREFIKGVYPGPGWAAKVDAMKDDQVIAVFYRLKAEESIEERATEVHPEQGRLF